MTNQNNAAHAPKPQTVLSFDERERILCQFIREPINHDREMAIAIETAVLSKLRAPVADERTAFEEWRMKELDPTFVGYTRDELTLARAAWDERARRAALASAPVAGEATSGRQALLEAIHRYGNARAMAEHNIAYRDEVRNTADALLALFDAAPQASAEDVRNAALVSQRQEWANRGDGYGHWVDVDEARFAVLAPECRRTLYLPQADKDGGQQRAAEASAPDTAKDRADKILRERMAPISEALGLDVMIASVDNGAIQITTFDAGTLSYSIGVGGVAMLQVSFNCPDAPDTLTADQVKIISQASSETQPEPQPARAAVAGEVVGWAAVPSRGKRAGRIYCTCDTREQIDAYIEQVHQSNDSLTLWARPLSFADAAPQASAEAFDFVAHLTRQAEFSARTFGPGARVAGVCDHIRKELIEVETSGGDLKEWVDVIILGLDGAWRSGATPQEIIAAIVAKQAKNEARTWPDWRTVDPTKAIEHDRGGQP